MKPIETLLRQLNQLDIHLWLEAGRLRYSAPKGKLTAALKEEIAQSKTDLIRFLEQVANTQVTAEVPIPPVSRQELLPLSFGQQRLWFLNQLEQGRTASYNMPPIVVKMAGPLQVKALEQSVNHLLQRHEILRTSFQFQAGQPVQVISPQMTLELPIVSLADLPESQRDEDIQRLTRAQAETLFDLTQPPLFRLLLVKLSELEHVLILTLHHIISDAWSLGILVRELSILYNVFATGGQTSPLPPLAIQYADFAVWQRQKLSGEFLDKLLHYWKQQLAGIPALLELPTDYPRRSVQRYRGKTEYLYVSAEVTQRLQQLSQQSGVTLFMTLVAIFTTLLHRYTGQSDIVIGTPIANRIHSQTEPLIGLFINTLVLRINFEGNPSFNELLQRVKQVALNAYAHQDLPFEKLVVELQPARNLSHTPLFQVWFGLQNTAVEEIKLADLTLTPLPTENLNAVFDLILVMEETVHGLEAKFRYNTDLFEEVTIKRLIGHYQLLLEGSLTQPTQPIHALPLLTATEVEQFRKWNRTEVDYSTTESIQQWVEAQVEKAPNAVAVVFENQTLTYRELNQKANQLANYLRSLGVVPDTLVGLCLERSMEMVIGLLGILKAGGAYVPLDPTYPEARLEFMLEDSQVPILLTQSHQKLSFLKKLSVSANLTVFCLDTGNETLSTFSQDNPVPVVTPSNLAYVIYTSGSTGKPKGALITHDNVTRLFAATQPWYHFNNQDVWTLFHSYAFDFSVWEIWGALMYGGKLIVVPYWVSRSPKAFYELLGTHGVTVLNQTPSAFRQLMVAEEQVDQPTDLKLRYVIFGGEALEFQSLKPWFDRHGDLRPQLVNMYGITETTVHVTYRPLSLQDLNSPGSVVGIPIPDLQIYILDNYLQLMPIGVPGEIHVGGAGLARGYLNRPDLTAARFIPNPFVPWARLYKTGDLARYLSNDQLEYLGRIDNQVKIRGFRIELGEIEAVLVQHPLIREALVIGWEEKTTASFKATQRLVAYLVNTAPVTPRELRQFLLEKLPEYMVPATFIMLEAFPLTANGKVDRRALPSPEGTREYLETAYVAPQTEMERLIARLWTEVLGVERIGIHDNFFELGGDSIKVAIFVNRLQEQLKKIVHVVALFEAPSIADFMVYLNQHYPELLSPPGTITEVVQTVDSAKVEHIRQLISPLPLPPVRVPKNPPAIFVLSPPRSGTTLMRVILGGHPRLFAPPELELLNFNTLSERKDALSGRNSFWLEGTLRAIMAIQNCDADEAKRLMTEYETQGWTVQQLYRQLQTWLGDRLLVDKSPSYALDRNVLDHAEQYFENTLYIHLLRHPYGMIHSFEEARLHQVFFRYPHTFSPRELAELVWLISHQNILEFLQQIPASRQHIVRFEELTQQPRQVVEGICQFIGLEFHPEMLKPYQDQKQRMTDGIYAISKMLGDVKFHTHKQIDSHTAERWKETYTKDFLSDLTWEMARHLGYERESSAILTTIQAIPRTENLPLSFAQQRLWFLYQLEGPSATYNMTASVRLEGTLNEQALQQSFELIVQRHENLLTCFITVNGEPSVRIAEEAKMTLQVVDLRIFGLEALAGNMPRSPNPAGLEALAGDMLPPPAEASSPTLAGDVLPPPAEASSPVRSGISEVQEREVQRLLRVEVQHQFDLERGPLFRATLLRLHSTFHILSLNMHHIISDGWSLRILIQELVTLYNAISTNLDSSEVPLSTLHSPLSTKQPLSTILPPLPIQYVDFAQWQRQWLQGARLAQQVNYWKQQLTGAPALLELPTDFPRPPVQQFRGANAYFQVPLEVMQPLEQISRQAQTTLFMTTLATFAILLSRYSGQRDIVIGSPIAGRTLKEIEPLIGFFVNTLVLRLHLEENPTVDEFLQQVRQVTLGAYTHQEIPFEQLVEELQPARSLSYSPLFQVMFMLQSMPLSPLELVGLSMTPLMQDNVMVKFDLTVSLEETPHGLSGTVEYNSDLFTATTIQRLINHYQTLLTSLVSHRQQPVLQLPLLSVAEEQQIRVTWNNTQVAYPTHQCVHQLFESQVEKTPDAIAVVFEEQTLSYRQLNQRANQLAHYLQTLGVQPETLVGICVERSLEMMIGLLGVLKAGGAYVPLDPAFPSDRLAFYVEDANVTILVIQSSLKELFASPSIQRVCLDTGSHLLVQHSPDNPRSGVTPANLAYVIYTSGSTGKPKGVMIGHQAVVNFLSSMRDKPGLTSRDVLMAVTTISFDIAGLELYLPLLVGAKIILARREWVTDGPQLLDKLMSSGTTVMQATPATWRLLLASGWESPLPLKVLCGGEALTRELSSQLLDKSGAVWNLYGPTETTIWSAVHQVSHSSDWDSKEVVEPLGYPIANTQFYILDTYSQVVPVGVAGELHIGGDGLARGYLNRPELTAEKFIPHPFSNDHAAKIYKTGDLARYLPNGNIEYLGRLDNQVKIRGFRIELGEIEAALVQHPSIRQSVVLVHTDTTGEKRLVAYLVMSSPDLPVDVTAVREVLKQRLPDYMIPAVFISLPAFPLTPNGKVNRLALPAPEAMARQLRSHYVAPRDTVELQLVPIWEDLLNVHPIGIQDNFFELGGHSLLAVRLMAQIERQFQKRLQLASLFQGATIEQQARLLHQHREEAWSALVPIQPKGSQPPFFGLAGAGGHVLYFYELARHLGSDQPCYGLQPRGLDGDSSPHQTVEEIATYYIETMRTVQPQGPYRIGGHSFGGWVAYEMAQQLRKQGEEVALLAILDTPAPRPVKPHSVQDGWDKAQWLTHLARIMGHLYHVTLSVTEETLRELAPETQLRYVHDQLKQAQILPNEASIKPFRGIVEVYKANVRTHYYPKNVEPVTLTLFRARDAQPDTLAVEEAQNRELWKDPAYGWSAFGEVTVMEVPGDHLTMLNAPQVEALAGRLRESLQRR